MEANKQPLVSVPVITYNSAKYVLETLESIKAQTYQNIELIISDDCSTDNTVELCQQWINKHKDRFVRTEIITIDINTGVSANLNRAEAKCLGKWVKSVAGDDLLMHNCIENYVNYVTRNKDVVCVFGRVEVFGATEERSVFFNNSIFDYSFFQLDVQKQLYYLTYEKNCIPASTLFFNRNKFKSLSLECDESIPLLDDWPRWIKALISGVKFDFIDITTVLYRLHENSISTSKFSFGFYRSNFLFDLKYRYPQWRMNDESEAIEKLSSIHLDTVRELCGDINRLQYEMKALRNSNAYKVGKFIVRPFSWFRRILKKMFFE